MAQLKDLIVTGAGRIIGKLYASAFSGNGEDITGLNASNISNGILSSDRLPIVPVVNGGTGATDAAAARTNLGAAASSHEHSASDISSGILSSDRLPIATSNMLGGIKVGDGLSVDSSGLLSASGNTKSGWIDIKSQLTVDQGTVHNAYYNEDAHLCVLDVSLSIPPVTSGGVFNLSRRPLQISAGLPKLKHNYINAGMEIPWMYMGTSSPTMFLIGSIRINNLGGSRAYLNASTTVYNPLNNTSSLSNGLSMGQTIFYPTE